MKAARLVEAAQAVGAKLDQVERRKIPFGEMGRRVLRDDHLSAVARIGDTRGLMHGQRDIVATRRPRLAGVHPNTNPDHRIRRPCVRTQRALNLCCRLHGRCGVLEREEAAVAFGPDLRAAVFGGRLADHAAMLPQQRFVTFAEPGKEARRTFDVGEAEADRAGRKRLHLCGSPRVTFVALLSPYDPVACK